MSTPSTVKDHCNHLAALYSRFERTEVTPIEEQPAAWDMEPLKAYRRNGAILCAYLDEADEQKAFNIVATAWGFDGKVPTYSDLPDWMLLAPNCATDPTGQRGYVGVRAKRPPLQEGEFIARAWKTSGANSLTCEDVVVTSESLAALRESGKYDRIEAPKRRAN